MIIVCDGSKICGGVVVVMHGDKLASMLTCFAVVHADVITVVDAKSSFLG